MKEINKSNEGGYVIIAVLLILIVGSLAVAGSLDIAASNTRTTFATQVRSTEYYDAESSVNQVVSWMRQYSQQMVSPFRRGEFYTRFDRTVANVGNNDNSGIYTVPTKVKIKGSNDSALLVTDASLANTDFPFTKDIVTNTQFAIETTFGGADHGGDAQVRLTLIDAVADNPAQDFGPSPNPAPQTDFYPIYRIDAMMGVDSGSHVYGVLVGDLAHVFDIGIYGQDYLEIRQACDSYLSSAGNYSVASRRANCPAGSNSTAAVHKNEEIYGTLQTNGTIQAAPPFGGETCADFDAGCPNKGETCAGEDCGVPLLELYDAWAVYCPAQKPAVVYGANTTLQVIDSNPADADVLPIDRCWQDVKVGNGVTLTLESTNSPYYIEQLDLANTGRIVVTPNVAGGTVELWVRKIVGDKLNGTQTVNTPGKPTQFSLIYLGTDALVLNGNANMNVAMVAPNAAVTVSGNFDYHGALLAKQLTLTGSGGIHYDESLGGSGLVVDVQYRLKELVQRYR